MRELYYAFYKNSPYKVMVLVSLAEAIYYKKGKFINEIFVINEDSEISGIEKSILEKIELENKSDIKLEECDEWGDFLIEDCVEQGFLSKFFAIYIKTSYFKDEIENHLRSGFNKDIIEFIDSMDTMNLFEIIPELNKLNIPNFARPAEKIGPYNDSLEMIEDAERIRHLTK